MTHKIGILLQISILYLAAYWGLTTDLYAERRITIEKQRRTPTEKELADTRFCTINRTWAEGRV